jgi:hypothetical protein
MKLDKTKVSGYTKEEGVTPEEAKVEATEAPQETPQEAIEETTNDEVVESKVEYKDEDVLSFIKDKTGKEISSFDDLFSVEEKVIEKDVELPEDIKAYLEYNKKTGRGLEDYSSLNKDYSDVKDDELISKFLKSTESYLDDDDISYKLSKLQDDELDDDDERRGKALEKKQLHAKALKYFEDNKEQYYKPIESKVGSSLSEDELKAYSDYKEGLKANEDYTKKASDVYVSKTEGLFSDDFKGFEFDLGDKKVSYVPQDIKKTMESQMSINNFISKHLDENNYLKDAHSYHKGLNFAMNPDAMAKFFYEQGKADAVSGFTSTSKNNSATPVPKTVPQNKVKYRVVSDDSPKQKGKLRF